jgi:hypothetical protein
MSDSYEHGNEPTGSTKSREFPNRLNNYHIFKEDPLP